MRLFSRELLMRPTESKFDPITFNIGGTTTEWTIPKGITMVRIECVASRGKKNPPEANVGRGGKVECILKVSSIRSLFITVADDRDINKGAYNSSYISTVANDMNSRLIVAGGGGDSGAGIGGDGGNLIGEDGSYSKYYPSYYEHDKYCGHGGTQTLGGTGPTYTGMGGGKPGSFGFGGFAFATRGEDPGFGGGNDGGDGWYGGGSGIGNMYFSGSGGGGSSYTHPVLCSEIVHTQGFNAGTTGWVTISMV